MITRPIHPAASMITLRPWAKDELANVINANTCRARPSNKKAPVKGPKITQARSARREMTALLSPARRQVSAAGQGVASRSKGVGVKGQKRPRWREPKLSQG